MIKKYLENLEHQKKIEAEIKKIEANSELKLREIRNYYLDIENQIENEKNEKNKAIHTEKEQALLKQKEQKKALSENILKVERIFHFIDIYIENQEIKASLDFEVSEFGKMVQVQIEDIIKKYMRLKIVIIENDKPKNKYSLCVAGKHIFNKYVADFPYDYGTPISTFGLNIQFGLKDMPDIENLKHWYELNRAKKIEPLLTRYKEIEREYTNYTNIKENYLTKEWLEAYLDWKQKVINAGKDSSEYANLEGKVIDIIENICP